MNDILIGEWTIPNGVDPDVKKYIATQTYVTKNTDTLPNIVFEGSMAKSFSLTKELSFFVWSNQEKTSSITIELINDQFNNYDDLIDYEFIRDSRIKFSIVKQDASHDTAIQIADFVVDQVSNPNDITTKVQLLDKTSLFDKNSKHEYFEDTIQFENNRNQPEPIAIGYVYQDNISLIDKNNGYYQVNSGFTVFDGINFSNNHVLKERADPFVITTDYTITQIPITLGLGIDLVNATNDGTITCDYIGPRYDSIDSNIFEGFVGQLLVNINGSDATDIDFTSAASIDTQHGYNYGYRIKTPTNVKSILSAACASHCGFFYQRNDGKLAFDYLQPPAALSVRYIGGINLPNGVNPSIDLAKGLSDSVAARKNVYVFSYDDVRDIGGLSEEDKQKASSEFQFYVKSTTTVAGDDVFHDTYAHARNGCYIPTLLTEESNAEDLITQLEGLYAVKRKFYEFDFEDDESMDILTLDLNDTIKLTHPRHGLKLGKNLRVVKIQIKDVLKGKATIVAWG